MSRIFRRYFVMNSFDGALTTFGMLLGSFASQVNQPLLILHVGLGTAIAIGFSGLTGALMTERAERNREIKAMERALNRRLDNTDYKHAYDLAVIITALVDGISPVLTSTILLSPFLIFDINTAYACSFGLALALFFGLGAFLGRISHDNLLKTGLKLLFAGLLCMLVILLLESWY